MNFGVRFVCIPLLILSFLITSLYPCLVSADEPDLAAKIDKLQQQTQSIQFVVNNATDIEADRKKSLTTSLTLLSTSLTLLRAQAAKQSADTTSLSSDDSSYSDVIDNLSLATPVQSSAQINPAEIIFSSGGFEPGAKIIGATTTLGMSDGFITVMETDTNESAMVQIYLDTNTAQWYGEYKKYKNDVKKEESAGAILEAYLVQNLKELFKGLGKKFGTTDLIFTQELVTFLMHYEGYFLYDYNKGLPKNAKYQDCVPKTLRDKLIAILEETVGTEIPEDKTMKQIHTILPKTGNNESAPEGSCVDYSRYMTNIKINP